MKRKFLFFCFVALAATAVFNTTATKGTISNEKIVLEPDDPPSGPDEPKPKIKSF